MSVRASSHLLTNCCLVIILACLIEGAPGTASSSSIDTSASASASANQRLARSASRPAPSNSDEEDAKAGCATDFVENFFRILSGPVGKEAEALVAAVLKLLSEDDRINWPALADQVGEKPPPSPARTVPVLVPAKHRIYNQPPAFIDTKRMSPKFNPTGWRRKRDVSATAQGALERLLRQYDVAPVAMEMGNKASLVLDADDVSGELVPETSEWQKEKRDQGRLFRRIRLELKPKRRPLEFNPTGW
ncbi:hypothetical protein BaRGS_00025882 [Batillaria attramentaria]|uniref:Uncharacterized protein n=1 Tax=Batillaria attramentaria TaxID=370345 RepID=A0ABD0K6U1_9CAEN|nr:hypothetical protein BaRGS_016536 [Batillaria attramentaria]